MLAYNEYKRLNLINWQLFDFLASEFPEKWELALEKFKFLKTKKYPTINQLSDIAKFFNIPFGYFFLKKIPEITKIPIPHYRTKQHDNFKPSLELIDTVKNVMKFQNWAKELLIEWGNEPLYFAGKFSTNTDYAIIVNTLREILGLSTSWAKEIKNWQDSFKLLVKRAEDAGIFVVINGVVGNNTHRKLDVNEFRGFVLYDNIAPFIFINNNDSISGKIFTLIHEIVHILISKSASFDLRNLQPADNQIEKFCNYCAAEFLVPAFTLQKIYKDKSDYKELAKIFKVSPIVIARRLLDLKLIKKTEFFKFYNDYTTKEIRVVKKQGGDFYPTLYQRVSNRFIGIIVTAFKNQNISYVDFYRLLSIQPKTAGKILKKLDE